MANLRGNGFEKQAKDAFHRLERFGVARHGTKDNLTHSVGLAHKREGYLRDIQQFSSENKLTGKLNQIMSNPTIMDKFFRLPRLSGKDSILHIAHLVLPRLK